MNLNVHKGNYFFQIDTNKNTASDNGLAVSVVWYGSLQNRTLSF
jgi:hypothetical protein